MPETTSSDESVLDPRIKALLSQHHAESDELEAALNSIIREIEREAIFGESCNAEEFIRGLSAAAIKRGETHSARFLGPIAQSLKSIREQRFPDLIAKLRKASN